MPALGASLLIIHLGRAVVPVLHRVLRSLLSALARGSPILAAFIIVGGIAAVIAVFLPERSGTPRSFGARSSYRSRVHGVLTKWDKPFNILCGCDELIGRRDVASGCGNSGRLYMAQQTVIVREAALNSPGSAPRARESSRKSRRSGVARLKWPRHRDLVGA